ncbi:hypothetical protein EZV73_04325 [Acidaminobacter sp. JC074]|uniref:ABC transporter permease n=1 Tax=Acidaminobacter sp. JC074 TaxID=2530199 RepID=UPI001F10BCD1|nr:ABC transporter permease [Acidaminobacter sp. JC074]MCH4886779.1 hypothetical protein [Acidaminobacter sp. JC074]
MNLFRYELKKLSSANYLVASFLVMLLVPLITLLWISLNPRAFLLGDFNKMNLIFLGLIGTKTIFPMTGMLLMKVEYDSNGFISAFVSPLERRKLFLIKFVIASVWSVLLILFSVLVVIVTEVILFNDLSIIGLIISQIDAYFYLILYTIPFIVFGMFLAYAFKHTIIPLIGMSVTIVTGYLMQLFNKNLYLPSAIPEFILSPYREAKINTAYLILYTFGILTVLLMDRMIYKRDNI